MIARGAGACGAPAEAEGRGSWRRALSIAAAITWLPHLVMAIVMQLTVSPGHCTETAWSLLPVGPGLLAASALGQWFDFLPRAQAPRLLLGALLTLGLVAVVARCVRRGGLLGWAVATAALIATSFAAVGTWHMIRM